MRCLTASLRERLCFILVAILTTHWASAARAGSGQILETLIRRTAKVGEDVPLRKTEELLESLSRSKAAREAIEKDLMQSGKLVEGVEDSARAATRSREVLAALRRATSELDPAILRDLGKLDDVSRESALVLARGGEAISKGIPDLAARARFLKEGGPETVAAIGLHGQEAAREATHVAEAIASGGLVLRQGQRAVTLVDFGAAMTKFGSGSWTFWNKYVQPHWKAWLASGALAAYLTNPEYFQDATGRLTEEGFKRLATFAGELAAKAIRGAGQGAGEAVQKAGEAIVETYFQGWKGVFALIGTGLILFAVSLCFGRIRYYVFRPIVWLRHAPKSERNEHGETTPHPGSK